MNHLFSVVIGTLLFWECLGERIIITKSGEFMGKKMTVLNNEIYAYLGIPYAMPPINTFRFLKPLTFKGEKGIIYNATEKPPSCMQNPVVSRYEWIPDLQNMKEDCLYLNIWVPAKNKTEKSLSTMVWIHGGGYNTGSSNLNVYDGGVMASLGNVIVISINYRLGAFGFFYLKDDGASGNVAMLDQVEALKWINQNIEAFGGDVNKITLFGQSAGAWSVNQHLASPLSKGLFKRAILESGSIYQPSLIFEQHNTHLSLILASELGCIGKNKDNHNYTDIIICMKDKNATDISFAEKQIAIKLNSIILFLPQIKKPFLDHDTMQTLYSGKIKNVDIMLGNVEDEGSLFLAAYNEKFLQEEAPIMNKTEFNDYIRKLFKFDDNVMKSVSEKYMCNVSDDDYSTILKRTHQVIGDWAFKCPVTFFADKLAQNKLKVFHYVFSHRRTINGPKNWTGVPHFEEVPFIFGMPLLQKDSYTEEERKFSENLIHLWTSFAKTGKPSYPDMIDSWLPLSKAKHNSIQLKPGNIKTTKLNFNIECEFWKEYYPKSIRAILKV